jgi:hypothetical protein
MFSRVSSSSGKRRLIAGGLATLGLTTLVAALVAGVVLFHPGRVFGSGTGGGGCFSSNGPSCTFKGHNAFADFGSVSPDGCVFSDASVFVFDNFTNPGRVSTKAVQVNINVFNNCTGMSIESLSNIDPSTFLADFTGSFTFGTGLSSLTLNGTAPMFDNFSGAPSGTATLSLTWKGYGPTFTFEDNNHSRSPGFALNSHSKGASRSAEASGTFTDPSGTNFASTPTLNADLGNAQGGTVQFSKS